MKIFLDTADIEEIRIAARWGVLDGVTTNPTLYAKVGGSYEDILREVCSITPGPVSAEVVADDVHAPVRDDAQGARTVGAQAPERRDPRCELRVRSSLLEAHPLAAQEDRSWCRRGPHGVRFLQGGVRT